LGRYRDALADCSQALAEGRRGTDLEVLALALNNLGLAREGLGQLAQAEALFQEALAVNRRRGAPDSQVINLTNLGNLAAARGRYERALRLLSAAEGLARRHLSLPWAAEQAWIARLNQAAVLEKVGAYREALAICRALSADSEDVVAAAEAPGGAPHQRAALAVMTGVLYRNLGDPVRAVRFFHHGIDEYRRLGDPAALSNAHLNLALALDLDLAAGEAAETAYRHALALARESGDSGEEVQDLFYLGRFLVRQSRLDEAETAFRAALARAIDSAEGRWSAREGLGRTALARGDAAGALAHLETAVAEIEGVRSELATSSRRAGFFGDKRSVYAAAVEALWRLEQGDPGGGSAREALAVVGRAKARDLADALRTPQATLGAFGPVAVRGAVVVEYFVGERDLFRWVVRGNEIEMTSLGPAGPLLAAAAEIHRSLAAGADVPRSATELGKVLLGGLGELPAGSTLFLAPDSLLRYLPFEALPAPDGRGLLVDRTAVAYLPGAGTLQRAGDGRRKSGLRLLAIGSPRLGSARPATPLGVATGALPPLPAAEEEVGAIARLLGGDRLLLLGENATEGGLRTAAQRAPRVVHFATHTVVDERPGRETAILLTPAGADDGLLTPNEIAGLSTASDLTVLSACRTSPGLEADGRALATLTGAFLAAGSRAVVATLWDVGDRASAAFMEQLYFELGRGRTPAEALHRAKRRLRADPRWNRPHLWGAYVVYGDAPPVAGWRVTHLLGAALALAAALGCVGWALSALRARRARASA
jgi:tetratricopeptide (TPR) repeat protein